MSRISQIKLARKAIELYFDEIKQNVFNKRQLECIFYHKNSSWKLGYTYSFDKFLTFLQSNLYLKTIEFSNIVLYVWKMDNINNFIYEIALMIKPKSYISHYTAMFLQNLTEQVPKIIYVTYERTNTLPIRKTDLSQSSIDSAFQKDERISRNIYELDGFKIILISSPRSNKIGIINYTLPSNVQIPITNTERTLLDITVRPTLSGGVLEIAKAYTNALSKLQVVKLKSYLLKMQYIYPYQQAVGFYLAYAGLPEKRLHRIEAICDNRFDFYLDRKMNHPSYSKRWRIYYPKYLT